MPSPPPPRARSGKEPGPHAEVALRYRHPPVEHGLAPLSRQRQGSGQELVAAPPPEPDARVGFFVAMQRRAQVSLTEQSTAIRHGESITGRDTDPRRGRTLLHLGHEQTVVAVDLQPDVLGQRPRRERRLVELVGIDCRLPQDLGDLVAMETRLLRRLERLPPPRLVTRQLTRRGRGHIVRDSRPVDVPLAATGRVVMIEDASHRRGERRAADPRRVGHLVAAAEHAVHLRLRRQEPTPPRHVEVLKPFDRQSCEVDLHRIRQTNRHELPQQRCQFGPRPRARPGRTTHTACTADTAA